MDLYDDDILKFWKALNQFKGEFIMVGDYAACIHGHNRLTPNIEIWINDTTENRKKLAEALEFLSIAPAEIVQRMQFIPGWTNFSLHSGFPVDIMTSLKGLEGYSFDDCLQMAIKPEIEGVSVPFLHINHLLEAKRAANRPKDQLDIIELERISRYLDEKGSGS
jgi:hypothetical protein